MAPKDYVKRTQKRKSPAKRNTKRKPQVNKNASQQTTPWVRIAFALLLISGFVYGLYVLQRSDTPSTDTQVPSSNSEHITSSSDGSELLEKTDITTNSAQTVKPLPPLPVLEEEEWEYIDALPEFSVEVDATGPVESDREYIMQCGSFRSMDSAEELKARLAFQGFESRIVVSNGGAWHRVVLGPYTSKREAERDRHDLRRADIQRCKIW